MRGRLLVVAALAAAIPGGARGQATVRSVRVVADLTAGDGIARVRITYRIGGTTAGSAVVATALEFAGARVEDVRLRGADDALAIDRPRPLAGVVRLAPGPSPDATDESEVVAAYTVPGAVVEDGARVRVHVPVLSVDLPPEAASPGLFHAELRLPPGWRMSEGFPTGLTPTGSPGVHVVDLAVVPAVVSVRARSDGRWRPGLKDLLDAAAVLLVTAFSVVGWRHLREEA